MIDSKDISVVVQGAIDKKNTLKCLKSIRKFLPEAEIILSTWENSDVEGLDYDILVLNQDPGFEICDYICKTKNNVNRQIISTLNGLKSSNRKYTMKLRSDMIITSTSFLKCFSKYDDFRNPKCKIFKNRIIINNLYCANPIMTHFPFHISDWTQFGLREDLLNLWDIPLYPKDDNVYFSNKLKPDNDTVPTWLFKYIPEQFIAIKCLEKNNININCAYYCDNTDENISLTELFFANNFVILNYEKFGIKFLKYNPYIHGTQFQMSYRRWLSLYIKYCNNKYKPSFIDSLILNSNIDLEISKLIKHINNFKCSINIFNKIISNFFSICYYSMKILFKIFFNQRNNNDK